MNEEIKLSWKGKIHMSSSELFVGRVISKEIKNQELSVILEGKDLKTDRFKLFYLDSTDRLEDNSLSNIKGLNDIEIGDIISVKNSKIRSVYRTKSNNNFIFATIRCNSNCLMCSQPPLDVDDTLENYLIWNYTIDLLNNSPRHLTITGGEPTLLGERLVLLINKILDKFPDLLITILSNGRMLALENVIDTLSNIRYRKNVVFAIPLYSDVYKIHDHIVQAKDAFYQTCLGIHKISSLGFPVEIRVVLHKLSNPRLLSLSKFIHKNFPFVYHVTFMGLEIIGYTKANKSELIEENTTMAEENLLASLKFLSSWKYNVSIYNTPLCHIPESLWSYAKQSISDWKNSFKPECERCLMKKDCSGFFTWNIKYAKVKPFLEKP
ncbi:His-Xaa-Ser system radical SAM maturase HxsC [Meridianimaribacter flavus]|uniref:His-Xaa-Ser system radical SAM maturase HxsC n=1 Tax=Meridianimaribacter flavus TaxID=571115 RepID=A0ABY2G7Z5_9FLAO|nr:His-Xaa-Ser system radical SAM maturase HxsC [Meridianimaribacter flavus]TDY12305.1 His-Xaa-Ser system radical SAM maturase HxsC [Meridianimaribacter flavus]